VFSVLTRGEVLEGLV